MPSDFRDRHKHGDLQALCLSCASLFASQRRPSDAVFSVLTDAGSALVDLLLTILEGKRERELGVSPGHQTPANLESPGDEA